MGCARRSPGARDGKLNKGGYVENQGHLPGSQDAGPADTFDLAEHLAQRLDHRLEFPEQAIDDQTGALAGMVDHDDAAAAGGGR